MTFDDHLRMLRLEFLVTAIAAKIGVDLDAVNEEIRLIEEGARERRRYEARLEEDVVFRRSVQAGMGIVDAIRAIRVNVRVQPKPLPAEPDRPRA